METAEQEHIRKLTHRVTVLEKMVAPKVSKAKWYDNIPEGGVLCWVRYAGDSEYKKQPALIVGLTNMVFESVSGAMFDIGKAKPLTKQEIQVYLDNAIE